MIARTWSGAAEKARRLAVWVDQWLHQRPLILCYHRIAVEEVDPWALAVSLAHFCDHLEILRRSQRRVVPLSEIHPGLTEVVAITFDDGYADNLHAARPILDRYDMPATFFLATGRIGSNHEFWWDELDRLLTMDRLPSSVELDCGRGSFQWQHAEATTAAHRSDGVSWRAWQRVKSPAQDLYLRLYGFLRPKSELERSHHMAELRRLFGWEPAARPTRRALTWPEVDELLDTPRMAAGGHTVHHVDLATTTTEVQRFEIEAGKKAIEERIALPVVDFAYPYGTQSPGYDGTAALVRQAGFTRAYTIAPGNLKPSADPYQLPRMFIPDCNGDEFTRRLAVRGAVPSARLPVFEG